MSGPHRYLEPSARNAFAFAAKGYSWRELLFKGIGLKVYSRAVSALRHPLARRGRGVDIDHRAVIDGCGSGAAKDIKNLNPLLYQNVILDIQLVGRADQQAIRNCMECGIVGIASVRSVVWNQAVRVSRIYFRQEIVGDISFIGKVDSGVIHLRVAIGPKRKVAWYQQGAKYGAGDDGGHYCNCQTVSVFVSQPGKCLPGAGNHPGESAFASHGFERGSRRALLSFK